MFSEREISQAINGVLTATIVFSVALGFALGFIVFKGCGWLSERVSIEWHDPTPNPEDPQRGKR